MLILTDIAQDRRRVVLMQQIRIVFPNIDVLLADTQKNGNILRADDIPLMETCSLSLPAHNLCNVVAEHHPHRILNTNLTHTAPPAMAALLIRRPFPKTITPYNDSQL